MDDLIRRHGAIDAMVKHFDTNADLEGCDINTYWNPAHVLFVLEDLPSAEPKKGKWLPLYNGEYKGGSYLFECSECKAVVTGGLQSGNWFCKGCGADMRESE